jgi:hypothetical protein
VFYRYLYGFCSLSHNFLFTGLTGQLYGQAICCCCSSCHANESCKLTSLRDGTATATRRKNATENDQPPDALDRHKRRRGTEFFAVASNDGARLDVSRYGGIDSTLTVSSRLIDESKSTTAATTDSDRCRLAGVDGVAQSRGLYLEVPGSMKTGNTASVNEDSVSQCSSSADGGMGITVTVPVTSLGS